MTKENFTSINVVIDRSGSMRNLTNDTIGGFNAFLAEQKAAPGTACFSQNLFSVDSKLVHYNDINDVKELNNETYVTGGGTAILDALGKTINEVGARLAAMPEEERPSKVIVLVITDGQENSSSEFSKSQIKSMISHQEEVYSWMFVFMGANMDAVGEGTAIGVSKNNSLNYSATSAGTRRIYGAMSNSLRRARSMGAGMTANQSFFTPEEAKKLLDPEPAAQAEEVVVPVLNDVK